MNLPTILILRPWKHWGIVTAELKRVASLGRYMQVEGMMKSDFVDAEATTLRHIAVLCEELQPDSLYQRYANKKVFRRVKDFWETTDNTVKQYVKRMADRRLSEVVRLASEADVPTLFAPDERTALHIEERLRLRQDVTVTPVMLFDRHADGTTYRLQLRMDEQLVTSPMERHLTVLAFEPGMFILDHDIYLLSEGFSGKLLLPFVGKKTVEIPRRVENDYFKRFIQRYVAKAEVQATGFDIEDISEQPHPRLVVQESISGQHMLSLYFRYGETEYAPDSNTNGRVTLCEETDGFRFVRQMRNRQAEQHFVSLLSSYSPALSPRGVIPFAALRNLIDWLRQYAPELRQAGFDVVQPSDQVYYIGPLDVEQSESWHGDWLQTNVTIVLDNGQLRIPFRNLADTILRGEQEYLMPTGELLLIPEEWLQRYGELLLTGRPHAGGFMRHRSQIAEGESVTVPITHHSSPTIPHNLKATLRPYQQKGFEWLWRNFEAQTGCCLSDEMGLGKTLQTITLLLKYKETAKAVIRKPQAGFLFTDEEMSGSTDVQAATAQQPSLPYRTSLVVAPASVVHNWRNELARFAPSLSVCTYTGDTDKRRDKRMALTRWDVVVTTYRTLVNDIGHLGCIAFGIIVFDESQAFKTPTSQVHQAVATLQAQHRLALSGTPVENNLMELWSLMSVLNTDLLGEARLFQRSFVNPIARQMEQERADVLRRLIAPYFLKRTKEEVLSDLPERQDEVVVCPMTDEQTNLYAEELSRARNEWLDTQTPAARKQVTMMAALQRLRQIANGEGKTAVVFERLEQLRDSRRPGKDDKKVLIFSEYVSMLERVAKEMKQRGWQYDLLTGETQRREQVIAHFQHTPDCQFFLISLKAGGVGINLTAADYVFLLDPWWNRAAEEQAIARSHRIGQRHPVFVYRFVSENTLEQQILTLQERKQNLIDSVLPFICKDKAE